MLLNVIVILTLAIFAVVFITQVLIPLVKGKKLFPDFRTSDLQYEVEATREEVEELKEQNANLQELGVLLKQRKDLEDKINAKQSDVQATSKEKN